MNSRVACIRVVDFPLIVLVRNRAEVALYPYAVAENEHPHALLVAVNQIAESDVRVGMTVAQARNRCAHLRVVLQDTLQELHESEKIRQLLYQIGPNIEVAAMGEYYLELRGLVHLHNGEDGIAKSILRQFSSGHYPVQIGVASNKLVARIASQRTCPNGTLFVSRGEERTFLAPLPIAALGMPAETLSQLSALGLRTIRDITQLPMQEMTRRFGADAHCLAECMRGDSVQLVVPGAFSTDYSAEVRFDDPFNNITQLIENITRLLQAVLAPLRSSGQGCREIVIVFEGASVKPRQIYVKVHQLSASLSAWKRQVQHTLQNLQCAYGITTIRVTLATIGKLHANQLSLFSPANAAATAASTSQTESEQLPITRIAIVQKVLPEESVQCSAWNEREHSTTRPPTTTPPCFYAGSSLAELRLFPQPQGVDVMITNGQVRGIKNTTGVERVIRQCAPYNVSGGWWEQEFQRLYYEVATDRGMRYLLFRDELKAAWYVQGFFD